MLQHPNVELRRNSKLNEVVDTNASPVTEDLKILDRILDDIENLEDDKYVDTMLDSNNKKLQSSHNIRNNKSDKSISGGGGGGSGDDGGFTESRRRKRRSSSKHHGKAEEVQKLVVEKKLTATEQVTLS